MLSDVDSAAGLNSHIPSLFGYLPWRGAAKRNGDRHLLEKNINSVRTEFMRERVKVITTNYVWVEIRK